MGTAKPASHLNKHQAGGGITPSACWAKPADVPQGGRAATTSSPGVLALQGSPLLPGALHSSHQGLFVGYVSGGTGDGAHTRHSRSCPGRRVNSMTSCLWLFPSGTAATVTFTVCATRLVHGTGNVVEEVGGVPVGQG